jgi:hypothetical protein
MIADQPTAQRHSSPKVAARVTRALVAELIGLTLALGACRAEDRMQATLDKPAQVTAKAANENVLGGTNLGAPRVLLTITAYQPPTDKKPVEVVVRAKAAAGGTSQEIGRFAIVPATRFTTAEKDRHQSFALALPSTLADQKTLTLEVVLAPVNGGGQDARVEVGSAAIR